MNLCQLTSTEFMFSRDQPNALREVISFSQLTFVKKSYANGTLKLFGCCSKSHSFYKYLVMCLLKSERPQI